MRCKNRRVIENIFQLPKITSKTESNDVHAIEGDESVVKQEIKIIGDESSHTWDPIGGSNVVDCP